MYSNTRNRYCSLWSITSFILQQLDIVGRRVCGSEGGRGREKRKWGFWNQVRWLDGTIGQSLDLNDVLYLRCIERSEFWVGKYLILLQTSNRITLCKIKCSLQTNETLTISTVLKAFHYFWDIHCFLQILQKNFTVYVSVILGGKVTNSI